MYHNSFANNIPFACSFNTHAAHVDHLQLVSDSSIFLPEWKKIHCAIEALNDMNPFDAAVIINV